MVRGGAPGKVKSERKCRAMMSEEIERDEIYMCKNPSRQREKVCEREEQPCVQARKRMREMHGDSSVRVCPSSEVRCVCKCKVRGESGGGGV